MTEWFKVLVLKTSAFPSAVGSNPILSVKACCYVYLFHFQFHFVFITLVLYLLVIVLVRFFTKLVFFGFSVKLLFLFWWLSKSKPLFASNLEQGRTAKGRVAKLSETRPFPPPVKLSKPKIPAESKGPVSLPPRLYYPNNSFCKLDGEYSSEG